MTMYPAVPALLGSLRLATIRDVPRIAVVATAGFYYSPVFPWERRYHHQYPEDTFKSYEKMFADIIRDPEYVTLVVEDSFQSTENSRTGANITTDPDQPIPQPGESIIVGAASWKLQSGSARKGQFVDHEDLTSPTKPFYDGGLGRDKDKFHADLLDERCGTAEGRYGSPPDFQSTL
jgi:hypothetical protein